MYTSFVKSLKLVALSLTLLIALQQHACKQAVDPELIDEEVSNGILPLKVGYYWEYKTYALREDSTTGLEIERASWKVTRTSIGPSDINKEPLFHRVFVNPYDNSQSQFEWLYRNYDDGLYLMGGDNADGFYLHKNIAA